MIGLRRVVKPKSLLSDKKSLNGNTKMITRSAYNKKIVTDYKPIDPKTLPISPHVTIYKFPFNAIASISHRITGCALAAGFTAIGVTAAFSPAAIPAAFAFIKSSAILTLLTKTALVVPLTYHYFNGVRHLWWDSGEDGIESVAAVRRSALRVIKLTALTTLILLVI